VLPPFQEVGGSEGLGTCIAWVWPHMTHLPGVMAAPEPGTGGIVPQSGFLPPCLFASQSLATFPNGSYLSLGPLKAKESTMRELLDDMGGGSGPMPPPFHWDLLSQTQVREAGVARRSGGTYGGGSSSLGSKVWWTPNIFSFIFPLTRTAVCLCSQVGGWQGCTRSQCKEIDLYDLVPQ
jgi:hypothetical protein